jgi:hypothetical protein
MTGGTVLLTAGVDTLPSDLQAMVVRHVATFSDFNEDNDPRGKHAFGSFILARRKFFFKLDFYDSNMEFGSEDPDDPAKTARVLTIIFPRNTDPLPRRAWSTAFKRNAFKDGL